MGRFFFCSEDGSSLFLAHRLKQDGHDVELYVLEDNVRKQRLGEGIVPLAAHPEPRKGATVIFDSPGKGRLGMDFRRRGLAVIGGNPFDADLELDRETGTSIMKTVGIATPRTETMASIQQAQAFVSSHPGTWYFKPSGKTTTLTHHGKGKSLAHWLAWAAQFVQGEPFQLQQAIEGVEVSTEAWFDGTRFVPPFNSTIEEKHFLTGDLGPRTGCESNVVWTWTSDRAPLPRLTVLKLAGMLRGAGYVGPIDLNAIVDDRGRPHGLEWSARMGFDASQAWSLLLDGDYGDQLAAFARGTLARWQTREVPYAMTLRITVPPYPVESTVEGRKMAGVPIDPRVVSDARTYMPCDVRVEQGRGPVVAGAHGMVVVLGATGPTFDACRTQLADRAKELDVPEKQYRTDIVHRAEDAWAALEGHGMIARQKQAA